MRRTPVLLLAAMSLVACASRESPTPGESPLAVARVERIEPRATDWFVAEALGPLGVAMRALRPSARGDDAILLTQTGERVALALGPVGGPAPGDCVAIVPADPQAGLRARYEQGEARLAPSRACDLLGK